MGGSSPAASDDNDAPDGSAGGASNTPDAPGTPSTSYAIHSQIFTPDGASNLVHVVSALDDVETLEPGTALELPGYPSIDAYRGSVFVADAETPTISRYEVTDSGFAEPVPLSFMHLGLDPAAPGVFVTADKAYANDGPAHVIWSPTEMETRGEILMDGVDERDGFSRIRTSSPLLGDGHVLRTFFWQNTETVTFSEDTQLAVIDTDSDELLGLEGDARCPVLNKLSQADDGTVYLSTWLYSASMHHMFDAPTTCAVRIPAGSTTIDDEWVLDFATLTEGRQAAELHYVGDGKATLSVFHHERVDLEAADSPWSLAGTANWKVWWVDLEAKTASPMDELGWSAGDHVAFRHEGRFFIMLPTTADWQSTAVWEIAPDGTATRHFESNGWVKHIAVL